jgi:hypothetical protein
LIVGDGNLTFTEVITNPNNGFRVDPRQVTTSDLNTQLPLIANTLKDRGVSVLGGVDGRNLGATFGQKLFDRIVWNFPHTGSRAAGQGLGQLVGDFLKSASSQLNPTTGRVIVTVKNGPGGLASNNMNRLAEEAGLRVINSKDFQFRTAPGYQHTSTQGGVVEFEKGATTYIMGKKK